MKKLGDKAIKELQDRAYIVRNCSVKRVKRHIKLLQAWMCCACPKGYSDLCKECKTKAETKAILKALKNRQVVSNLKNNRKEMPYDRNASKT